MIEKSLIVDSLEKLIEYWKSLDISLNYYILTEVIIYPFFKGNNFTSISPSKTL